MTNDRSDTTSLSDERAAVVAVLYEHAIECTGPGEVSCGGCREAGWMSWRAYREHLADAIVASLSARPGAS